MFYVMFMSHATLEPKGSRRIYGSGMGASAERSDVADGCHVITPEALFRYILLA